MREEGLAGETLYQKVEILQLTRCAELFLKAAQLSKTTPGQNMDEA